MDLASERRAIDPLDWLDAEVASYTEYIDGREEVDERRDDS